MALLTQPEEDSRRRARRLGLLLGGTAVALFLLGLLGFWYSSRRVPADPGLSYRTPAILDKMLARGEQAEQAGDRGAAIAAYRFVVAVGAANDPELVPYIAAARRNLARLGAAPVPEKAAPERPNPGRDAPP